MDAETVVEVVQEDAAHSAALLVAGEAAGAVAGVESEVAAVAEVLEEHVIDSEERHEEILEGEEWLKAQLVFLLTTNQSLQTQLTSFQTLVVSKLDLLESILKLLQDSKPSIPTPEAPPVEAVVVVEPEDVEDPQEAKTGEPEAVAKPARRKRVI